MAALNIVERVAVRITIKVMQRDLKKLERERDKVKEDLKRLLFEAHAAGELVAPWPEPARRAYRRRTVPPAPNAEETPPSASSDGCGPDAIPAEARTPGP
jgi:hypothetical protein